MGIVDGAYNQTIQDFVSKTDKHDYYRIRVKSALTISAKLYGMLDDVNMQLLDGNGNVLVTAARTGTTSDSISRAVGAGTYYVHVYLPGSVETIYSLRLAGVLAASVKTAKPAAMAQAALPAVAQPSVFSTRTVSAVRDLLDA
jgi:hypothetical protein